MTLEALAGETSGVLRTGSIVVLLSLVLAARAAALEVGDKAPDFSLPDQDGKTFHLADQRGKSNVVIAFYVMAFTPG